MPTKARARCLVAGCGSWATHRGRCPAHARFTDLQRGDSRERGYTYRWEQARARFLTYHPLCASCQRRQRVTPATVVDHVQPHRGNPELFWNQTNWQALCASCHARKTALGG